MNEIDIETLRDLLDYDPSTGTLIWRPRADAPKWNGKWAGQVAGTRAKNGYSYLRISMRPYATHRAAFAHYHGRWPAECIDHVNGKKQDNRIENLREATYAQNNHNSRKQRNNSSGFKGVSSHRDGRWTAQIMVNGKRKYLGIFRSPEDAARVYAAASAQHHGEFGRV